MPTLARVYRDHAETSVLAGSNKTRVERAHTEVGTLKATRTPRVEREHVEVLVAGIVSNRGGGTDRPEFVLRKTHWTGAPFHL